MFIIITIRLSIILTYESCVTLYHYKIEIGDAVITFPYGRNFIIYLHTSSPSTGAVARLTREVSFEDRELIRILRHTIAIFIEDVIPTNHTIDRRYTPYNHLANDTFRDGDRSALAAVRSRALFTRFLLVIKYRKEQYRVFVSDLLSYRLPCYAR